MNFLNNKIDFLNFSSSGHNLKLILKRVGTKKQPSYKLILKTKNKQVYLVGFYISIYGYNKSFLTDSKKKKKLNYKFLYFNRFFLRYIFFNQIKLSKNIIKLFNKFNLINLSLNMKLYNIKTFEKFININNEKKKKL